MTAPDVDPFLSATPGDVERGIARRLRTRGYESWDEATRDIWSLVTPVLEAKDKEIARLREQVECKRPVTMGLLRSQINAAVLAAGDEDDEWPKLIVDAAAEVAQTFINAISDGAAIRARADEQRRCVEFLQAEATRPEEEPGISAALSAAAGLLTVRMLGHAVNPTRPAQAGDTS